MGKATLPIVMTIKSILRCFELVFGLKVNFKSRLRTTVVYMETEKRYVHLLICKLLHIPFVYLGIPIGASPKRAKTWCNTPSFKY